MWHRSHGRLRSVRASSVKLPWRRCAERYVMSGRVDIRARRMRTQTWGDDLLHLRDRHHGQVLDEEEEPHEEPAEASRKNGNVHPARDVRAPLPRLKFVGQRWHDDHEALEP